LETWRDRKPSSLPWTAHGPVVVVTVVSLDWPGSEAL